MPTFRIASFNGRPFLRSSFSLSSLISVSSFSFLIPSMRNIRLLFAYEGFRELQVRLERALDTVGDYGSLLACIDCVVRLSS